MSKDARKYGLGWLPDPPDPRDYSIRRFVKIVKLPARFEIAGMGPVRDQGQEGSCVGFACANLKDWQESKERGRQILTSPRFIYYEGRKLEGRIGEQGMWIRDAMKILQDMGVPPESCCPYDVRTVDVPCPTACKTVAGDFKTKTHARLDNVDQIKQTLYQLGPVVIGVPVFENWMTQQTVDTGDIPMPRGELIGGHAICLCGYDNRSRRFSLENSWGQSFGRRRRPGFGRISYDYVGMFLQSNKADAWKTVDITVPRAGAPPWWRFW